MSDTGFNAEDPVSALAAMQKMIESVVSTDDADTAGMLVGMRRLALCAAETYGTLITQGVPEDAARETMIRIALYPFQPNG